MHNLRTTCRCVQNKLEELRERSVCFPQMRWEQWGDEKCVGGHSADLSFRMSSTSIGRKTLYGMETYPSSGVPKEHVFLRESARAWGHPAMNYFGGNDFSKWQGKLLWKYECVFHWGVPQGRTEISWCWANPLIFSSPFWERKPCKVCKEPYLLNVTAFDLWAK